MKNDHWGHLKLLGATLNQNECTLHGSSNQRVLRSLHKHRRVVKLKVLFWPDTAVLFFSCVKQLIWIRCRFSNAHDECFLLIFDLTEVMWDSKLPWNCVCMFFSWHKSHASPHKSIVSRESAMAGTSWPFLLKKRWDSFTGCSSVSGFHSQMLLMMGSQRLVLAQKNLLFLQQKNLEVLVELTNMFLPSGRLVWPRCFMQERFRCNKFLETIAILQSMAPLLKFTMISTQINGTPPSQQRTTKVSKRRGDILTEQSKGFCEKQDFVTSAGSSRNSMSSLQWGQHLPMNLEG